MKVRYIGPFVEAVSIIAGENPTDSPTQITAKHGEDVTVSKHQASVLLNPFPNPNYEPADKAASALVAAPAAEQE